MDHLHNTSIGSHGYLTSNNCVIDNRWTCKITDYGMRLFRWGGGDRSVSRVSGMLMQMCVTWPISLSVHVYCYIFC